MIQPNCRARFTGDDFDFVVRTLAKSPSNRVGLVELLSDVETRDQILDHADLVRAVAVSAEKASPAPIRDVSVDARLAELERQIWRERARVVRPF